MNLTNFLKQTDEITEQYSEEQFKSFIHDIGRILPEHYREDFLSRLKAIGEKTKDPSIDEEAIHELNEHYRIIGNNLKTIASQEVSIEGILNETYDDWYDDGDEEFYYQDSSGVSDMLADACSFVHTCMDMERYREGFEIGNQLLEMEILCENEYGDEELSLADLVHHDLLHCDLMRVFLDTAYCAYHAVPLDKRAEALYEVIVNAKRDEVTLEAVMQHGDEKLPDFQDFLTLWVTYLGTKMGHDADRLILEAVALLNNVFATISYAEEYADVHPGLYLSFLENEKNLGADDMVSTGMKAMDTIPKKYIVRSKTALKTAEYVMKADKNEVLLEKCYFAAYESDTSALNYLHALLNGYGAEKKREGLRKILNRFNACKNDSPYWMYEGGRLHSEREENRPDRNMILMLRFLDGQFADVLEEGLKTSKALGWTGTFMKQGIAVYLLYLYEGEWSREGICAMADIVKSAMRFSEEEYRKGVYEYTKGNDLFYEVFSKWKSMVQMEPDVRALAIKRITSLLEKRVAGIMEANRRNYYEECAAYIAALGEVKESLGETGAKQQFMTSYKEKYFRRRAFREAMRDYGWMDIRR